MSVASLETDRPRRGEPAPAAGSSLHVLHLINGEHYAGAERVQDLLALRLPDAGFEVAFACLKTGRFAAMRQSIKTPLFATPMNSRTDLRVALRVASLVRREGYRILHTHGARALAVGCMAAGLTRVPIVHHVHGDTSSEVRGRRFARVNAISERLLLSRTQRVIAVSDNVRSYLRRLGLSAKRIALIPNGVPSRQSSLEVPGECSLQTLGFVGLLRPRKGLEVLLEAAHRLRQRRTEFRIRVVGRFEETSYERQVHALAEELGLASFIDWCGFQRDVHRELDRMTLLSFPSILPEGMPMVLLEAMAAGVPIVASDVDGVRQLLHHGEHALLVPPDNPEALANAAANLLDDPARRNQLRQAAFELQRAKYSDQSMAASVANVYRQVVAQRRVIQ